MVLKSVHDSQDEIPEAYRELYTEKDGKWELTGIQGVKTTADVARLESALTKERQKTAGFRDKLKLFNGNGDLSVDASIDDWRTRASEQQAELDKIDEYKQAAEGKMDEAAIDSLVSKRVEATLKSKLAPVERELATTKASNEELTKENTSFKAAATRRQIHDAVRDALTAAKIVPSAFDDALALAERHFEVTEDGKVLTREDAGVMVGQEPKGWLEEIQPKREHWWPGSVGGGSRGGGGGGTGGKNPFSHEHWNLTEQGRVLRDHGAEKAKQLAEAAGTTVGGGRPPAPKT